MRDYEKNEALLKITEAKILYPNFSGAEGQYNREGDRNFCVIIDDNGVAQELANIGWNIKIVKGSDRDGEEPTYYLNKVRVNYHPPRGVQPPEIYLVTPGNEPRLLTEENVAILDQAEIESAYLAVSPSHWHNARGEGGITGYLHTGYFVTRPKPFHDMFWTQEGNETTEETPW